MDDKKIRIITRSALIAALSYIGFQFLRIDIPVGTERTAIHLGNAFVVLGALLEGLWGCLAGALGLTLADLTSGYVTSAPKTFILKLVIGLITTYTAKKLSKAQSTKKVLCDARTALISSAVSLGVNVFLDPLFGYFYKAYIFGIPQDMAKTLSKIGSATTLVNAVVSIIIVTIIWPALSKALRHTNG